MKKLLLNLLFFCFNFLAILKSQINLVPNAGFESVDCFAQKLNNWKLAGFSLPFNECFPRGFSPRANLQPPFINPNPWGYSDAYTFAKTGNGFCGVEVSGGRGSITATLTEELKQYKTYFARLYVKPYYPIYDWIKWPYNDAIGIFVTDFDNAILGGNNFPYYDEKPVVENAGRLLKDTMNWTKVSGSFNARGGEKYIVVANFRKNEQTKLDLNGYVPRPIGSYPSNMFLIDDVVVSAFDPLPDTAILCANAPLVFDATFYDAKYRWSDYSENNTLTITKPGSYWVQARIDGVLLQDEVLVIPEKEFKPIPKDTVVCLRGPAVALSVKANAQFRWSTGQTSNSISLNSGGVYSVTVTTPQCTLQFSTNVKERDCFCDFYAPNTFTPNGDGVNDNFIPFINCKVIYVKGYKFSIFNRFGNLVFTTDNIDISWDGTYKGQRCSEDVYTWVVEYNALIDNDLPYRKVVESGDITLIN